MTALDPSLALQKAIRARLIASPELMALVPADRVLDANGRPEIMPTVYIGEGQTTFRRWDATSYATLHIWFQEPGLVQCKEAVSAIVAVLRIDAQADGVLPIDGFTVHDMQATQTRYLRDPHGSYSHGIVSVVAIVKARAV
ncbi:DUF3168 domain-containing protein [Bradyrhizobium diazoefficiens]|uniref:DUF3168 domain-containing protein n=1 Tax=Bradyrhizobium diazoefficiens TaxID=1355477 RepID=UPI0027145E5C|nr:DUF3168 domain-containing protein [Bradyrhizobium diazoefficiens]WLB42099.1 DUF3168 domain-containing protein [Bradyrhizobium diazoefficiens]